MMRHVVAVDGPAASGKSTLARRLALDLGIPFLDTGLLYRAVARRLIEAEQSPEDAEAALAVAETIGRRDLDAAGLHDEAVGQGASRVAALPEIRAALLAFQRRFAAAGAVLAGRDIGSVVCPDAGRKIYVTASVEVRAQRRLEELQRRGLAPIYGRVLQELRERDARDKSRAVSPLVVPDGAFVLDSTNLDADAAFAVARTFVLNEPARA